MTHEVFISYSHHDKAIADGVCANLESAGIRCWIAPRDIAPGHDWPTSISEAIKSSRVFVLIFSSRSNSSQDVGRELILAANNNCIIVPFKIEDVAPEPGKEYYLARTHWLDAMDPPTQEQVDKLVGCVRSLLVEAGMKLPPGHTQARIPPAVIPEVESSPKVAPPQVAPAPVPSNAKKQKKSLAGLWIVSASVLFFAVVSILLWTQRANIPALAGLFAFPSPTPTITLTASPTQTKTAVPDWQATAQVEIRSFADPILADVLSRTPNYETDFSIYDGRWGSEGLIFQDYVMHMRSPSGRTGAGGSHIAADDFVIQFEFSPVATVSTDYIQFLFRQEHQIYYGLDLSLGGSWSIYFNSSTAGHQVCDGMTGQTRVGQTRTVLFIAQGDKLAFYLDGQPIGYCQDDTIFITEVASLFVDSPTRSNIEVDFDNIKFWDLNNLLP
jgi:hypothetical protein